MTKDEAIEWIKGLSDGWDDTTNVTACNMAIKALEQKPCVDCISREAVRKILANQRDELMKLHTVNPEDNPKADAMAYGVNWSLNTLMELSSVTSQPKIGKWIADVDRWGDIVTTVNGYRCSECNNFNTDRDNYCPNCGAKMEVDE